MKNITIKTALNILLVNLSFLLFSCYGLCGGDERLGSIDYDRNSLKMLPDSAIQKFVFKNDSGEERIFTKSSKTGYSRSNVERTCSGDGNTGSFSYYHVQYLNTEFTSDRDRFVLEIRAQMDHDYLHVYNYGENSNMKIISHLKSTNSKNEFYNKLHYEINFGESIFHLVYESMDEGKIKFFYSRGLGVVAFVENEEVWVLQN